MDKLRFGDFVYLDGQATRYIGMDEQGEMLFCKPIIEHCFGAIEIDSLWPADEPERYDLFMRENALETFTERCIRKGIEVPK